MAHALTSAHPHALSKLFFALTISVLLFPLGALAQGERRVPRHVPPKRSSQIEAGFGINSDLPREPYLPWNRWWWTRMFDAGVKWIRIGQYENSSELTSWDWIEQKRGVYAAPPGLDDFVDSLVDNGVHVQVQLLYGNPMYTGPAGKKPDAITPEPGAFHNDDRSLYSIFWPPTTPDQIEAFSRYVRWVVGHYHAKIHYWALWNEEDIGYWNPWGNPEEYGRLLKAFVPAVHESDPDAKVIYGAQADPSRDFTQRAFDTCQCAAGLDVYAYHTYPGYGHNLNPETQDYGAYGQESPTRLRDFVRHYPGVRKDIPFWDDEFNSIPSWTGSDESVQSKYIPRMIVYNHARGVKTFVWLLAAGTDGNEFDDFGLIHGLRYLPDDFTPRPVYYAFQNTNALFSDTRADASIAVKAENADGLRQSTGAPLELYAFRSKSGKAIIAYWLAEHSSPGDTRVQLSTTLNIKNSGITHPVLIDVVSGEIRPVTWKAGTADTLENLPIWDSVMAIADESYFDWPVLPETPSSLVAVAREGGVNLTWEAHAETKQVVVERRAGEGAWQRIATIARNQREYQDATAPHGRRVQYRVRALNDAGESAYSNIATVAP